MKKRKKNCPATKRKELQIDELRSILGRAKSALGDDDYEKLTAAIDTLAFLTSELESKSASVKRLRQMLFGASTEKTSKVLGTKDKQKHKGKNKAKGKGQEKEDGPGHF